MVGVHPQQWYGSVLLKFSSLIWQSFLRLLLSEISLKLHKIFKQILSLNCPSSHFMCISSVQLLSRVLLVRSHEPQHARPPCPSPTPRVYPNSCPLSRWCHPTISSSVIPFSSCPLSFPASGSFPMSQFFASGGQSIGVSISASVLPMSIQVWFPLGLTDLISLQSKGLKSLLQHHSSKASVLQHSSFLYSPTLTALTRQTFVDKVIGNISYGL